MCTSFRIFTSVALSIALSSSLLVAGFAGCQTELSAPDIARGLGSAADVTTRGQIAQISAAGVVLGDVPIQHKNLDTVLSAFAPNTNTAAVVVNYGNERRAKLFFISRNRTTEVMSSVAGREFTTPHWSLDEQQIALVESMPPSMSERGVIQPQGRIWLIDRDGKSRVVAQVKNAAQIIGWVSDTEFLHTSFTDSDFPKENLHRFNLQTDQSKLVLDNRHGAQHFYDFRLVGQRVIYAQTDQQIITAPKDNQMVQLVAQDLMGGDKTTLQQTIGVMPESVELINSKGIRFASKKSALITPPSSMAALTLEAPYLHQLYDTPQDFDGHWACGPTSSVMAIQHFNLLPAKPIEVTVPNAHTSQFGSYVAYEYTFNGVAFNVSKSDASWQTAKGAYGWCVLCDGGGCSSWAYRIQDYLHKHGLKTDFYDYTQASFEKIKSHLDAGKMVILSNNLTPAGHVILAKGYTADGKIIANDPFGYKNLGTYPNYQGKDATYAWNELATKWHVTVYRGDGSTPGPGPTTNAGFRASVIKFDYPKSVTAGSNFQAELTLRNDGTQTWDEWVRVATTEPRGRNSYFFAGSKWLHEDRILALQRAVAPGQTITLTLDFAAPRVCSEKTFSEHFNLVKDGVAWFADDGGPKDTDIAMNIEVKPSGSSGNCDQDIDPKSSAYRPLYGGCNMSNSNDNLGKWRYLAGFAAAVLLVYRFVKRRRVYRTMRRKQNSSE